MFSDLDKHELERMEALIVTSEYAQPVVEEIMAPVVSGTYDTELTIDDFPKSEVGITETDVDSIPTDKATNSEDESEWTKIEKEDIEPTETEEVIEKYENKEASQEAPVDTRKVEEEIFKQPLSHSGSNSSSESEDDWTKVGKDELEAEKEKNVSEKNERDSSGDEYQYSSEKPVYVDYKENDKEITKSYDEKNVEEQISVQTPDPRKELETGYSPDVRFQESPVLITITDTENVTEIRESGDQFDTAKDAFIDHEDPKIKKKVTFAETVIDNERGSSNSESESETATSESESESENEGSYVVDRTKPEQITDLDEEYVATTYSSPDMPTGSHDVDETGVSKEHFEDDQIMFDQNDEYIDQNRTKLNEPEVKKDDTDSVTSDSSDDITSYDVNPDESEEKVMQETNVDNVNAMGKTDVLFSNKRKLSTSSESNDEYAGSAGVMETDVDNLDIGAVNQPSNIPTSIVSYENEPGVRKLPTGDMEREPSSSASFNENEKHEDANGMSRVESDTPYAENVDIISYENEPGHRKPVSMETDIDEEFEQVEKPFSVDILKEVENEQSFQPVAQPKTETALSTNIIDYENEPGQRKYEPVKDERDESDKTPVELSRDIKDVDQGYNEDLVMYDSEPNEQPFSTFSKESDTVARDNEVSDGVISSVDENATLVEDSDKNPIFDTSSKIIDEKYSADDVKIKPVIELRSDNDENEPGKDFKSQISSSSSSDDEDEEKKKSKESTYDQSDKTGISKKNSDQFDAVERSSFTEPDQPQVSKAEISDKKGRKSSESSGEEDAVAESEPQILQEPVSVDHRLEFYDTEPVRRMSDREVEIKDKQRKSSTSSDSDDGEHPGTKTPRQETEKEPKTELSDNLSLKVSPEVETAEVDIKEYVPEIEFTPEVSNVQDLEYTDLESKRKDIQFSTGTLDVNENPDYLVEQAEETVDYSEGEVIITKAYKPDNKNETNITSSLEHESERAESSIDIDPETHDQKSLHETVTNQNVETAPVVIETDIDSFMETKIEQPETEHSPPVAMQSNRSSISSESDDSEKRKKSSSFSSDDERSPDKDDGKSNIVETDLDAVFAAENAPVVETPIDEDKNQVEYEPNEPELIENVVPPTETDLDRARPEYVMEQYHSAIPVEKAPGEEGPPDKDEVYCETTLTVVRRVRVKQTYGSDRTEKQPTTIEQGLGSKPMQQTILDVSDQNVHPGKRSRSPSESESGQDVKRQEREPSEEKEANPPAREFIFAFQPSLIDQPDSTQEEYIRIPPYVPEPGSSSSSDSDSDGAGT